MNIFDSHAHYLSEAFDEDREALLTQLLSTDVSGIVEAGTTAADSKKAVALSEKFPRLWATVGIHPAETATAEDDHLAVLQALATHNKVVAIGEIGLDYHYEADNPREKQQVWFRRQLALARECSLPVVIHDREAHEDVLNILKEYRPTGVVHCFSGSVEMANEILKLGMHIGIGGVVTFKNARKLVDVAQQVPLDRLLLETDAPYLAPVPLRGHRCDSSMIVHTAAVIASLRGLTTQAIIDIAADNARRLYGI